MADVLVSVKPLSVTDVGATTLTGQSVAVQVAAFKFGPRTVVGAKAASWRPYPNTQQGRKVKVR